ncbi:MAG: acetoacetate--CoA ligase, partial [Stenotrophobium sp.]
MMKDPIWTPRQMQLAAAQLSVYADWLRDTGRQTVEVGDYAALWRWSVAQPAAFWESVWAYCDVCAQRDADHVLANGGA